MTTGTTIADSRYSYTYKGASLKHGRYYKRTWTGTDSAARDKLKKLTRQALPRPVFQGVPPRQPGESRYDYVERRQVRLASHKEALSIWRQNVKAFRQRYLRLFAKENSYSATIIRRNEVAYAMYRNTTAGPDYFGPPVPRSAGLSQYGHIPLDPKEHYRVIEKLRRKVYGSGFHPGIFLAEAPKALQMIGQSARQLSGAMVALRKGNWRGVIRHLGEVPRGSYATARREYIGFHEGRRTFSQAWLAFNYGWKPLVSDLEDGAAYLAYAMTDASTYGKSVKARRVVTLQDSSVPDPLSISLCDRETVHAVQYKITNLRAASPFLPSLISSAAVAWEVVPYSFIFDWVAPIGSYLQALRTAQDLKGTVVCSILSVTTYSGLRDPSSFKKPSYPIVPDGYQEQYLTVSRTVTDELAPPTPIGNLSPGSVFSHWSRAVSSVALLNNLKINGLDPLGYKKAAFNLGLSKTRPL